MTSNLAIYLSALGSAQLIPKPVPSVLLSLVLTVELPVEAKVSIDYQGLT